MEITKDIKDYNFVMPEMKLINKKKPKKETNLEIYLRVKDRTNKSAIKKVIAHGRKMTREKKMNKITL